ncbi:ATP phosphoribosyltransferase regulatory subunit [Alsobacter soli]|uniref:ATP phosphoribosyltransferase regulatory subunit n=1 Tax=Alsobacter soli TaxID=2109933 RepID=A0A2T1HSH1_9HYPH|nr:ATP phosphoribosyltransferase regulatory subunit [Alsobacter soli]PSC04592.1 ATP phosphoribosyltransferase regulatory subunit [Alsobacter soli]
MDRTPQDLAEALVASFGDAGYGRVEPPVLQPADVFLDLSGEDIRARMFVTMDAAGHEWALRPEYTIPVARAYLASPGAAEPAALSYGGPVFRLRAGESGEFWQAGIESYGRPDAEAADAEVLGIAVEAVSALGLRKPEIRLGDVGLFTALLDALALPPVRARQLRRAYAQGQLAAALTQDFSVASAVGGEHAGLLRAVQGQDPKAARAFVEDVLNIAGISTVGGRSAAEIAERFLARAEADADGGVSAEAIAVLKRFAAIAGDPDAASAQIRKLAGEAGLDIAPVLDSFDARTGFIAARGVDVGAVAFSAAFGRNLDYYTGVVFEIRDGSKADAKPIVGGGRYDRLLQTLGASHPIPAVGCSVWLDRLAGALA